MVIAWSADVAGVEQRQLADPGPRCRQDQRLNPLVGDELDIGGPAPSQGGDEYREPVLPRRMTAQSTCICSPGRVSNRITGSTACCGRSDARNSFTSCSR